MKRLYPTFLDALCGGNVDLDTATVKVQALSVEAGYDEADEFLDDLTSGDFVSTAVTITNVVYDGGTVDGDLFTMGPPPGDVIESFVVYIHTGTPSTSRLILFTNERADTTPISVATTGGTLTFSFPYLFKI